MAEASGGAQQQGMSLRTFMKYVVLAPLVIVLALIAVANRAPVTFSLDPFAAGAPSVGFSAPLYVVLLGAVAIGVAVGGFAAWLVQGKHRRAARVHRKKLERLEAETAKLREVAGRANQLAR